MKGNKRGKVKLAHHIVVVYLFVLFEMCCESKKLHIRAVAVLTASMIGRSILHCRVE